VDTTGDVTMLPNPSLRFPSFGSASLKGVLPLPLLPSNPHILFPLLLALFVLLGLFFFGLLLVGNASFRLLLLPLDNLILSQCSYLLQKRDCFFSPLAPEQQRVFAGMLAGAGASSFLSSRHKEGKLGVSEEHEGG